MASIQRMDAALGILFDRKLRDVHTAVRGVIVDVDLNGPTATIQPLASTSFEDGTDDVYPPIYDVPLQLVSANGGKARLTMPMKPGDVVGLTFSERNENDVTDVSTHGLNAGWAITSIYPKGGQTIHPDNVELWNDKIHFSMTPEGDFNLQTPAGNLVVDKSGLFKFSNGAANLEAQASGTIMMNGAQITPDGNLITKRGINMNAFYDYVMGHTHPYDWTDGAGQSNTKAPNQ